MSANHENDLSPGRRYKKYEAAYNLAFAADPNQQQRQFDEMAPKDDIQWKRLEVFRGNDKDAYDAYKSNPNDALVKPTEKEEHMWQANQADHWRINREPAFGQHDMTNNKWFDLTLEQRRADSTQNYFNSVEQRHDAGYEPWAAKAGNQVVAKEDYLQTMATMDIEKLQASRAQKQQAPEQSSQLQANQAPAQAQPNQSKPAQDKAEKQQAEPQQASDPPQRTRVSLVDFQGPTKDFTAETKSQLSAESDDGLQQITASVTDEYQARGLGRIEDAGPKIQALNALHAREVQQRNTRRQEVPSETFTQQQTYQQ